MNPTRLFRFLRLPCRPAARARTAPVAGHASPGERRCRCGVRRFLTLACAFAGLAAADARGQVNVFVADTIVDLVDGLAYVGFGYLNVSDAAVTYAVGSDNFLFPGNPNGGQPTMFLPGQVDWAFTASLGLSSGNFYRDLNWWVAGNYAVADANIGFAGLQAGSTKTFSGSTHSWTRGYEFRHDVHLTQTDGLITTPGSATIRGDSSVRLEGGTFTAANFVVEGDLTLAGGTLYAPLDIGRGGRLFTPSGTWSTQADVGNAGLIEFNGGTVHATHLLDNRSGGRLTVSAGTVTLADLRNRAGATVSLTGGRLIVQGGTHEGAFDWRGGTLELAATDLDTSVPSLLGANPTVPTGGTLHIGGQLKVAPAHTLTVAPGGSLFTAGGENAGRIYLTDGAFTSTAAFTNTATGRFTATDSTLTFTGNGLPDGDGLQNLGELNLNATEIYGDIRSPAGSSINIGRAVTFHGLVSGGGAFTGGGLATFAGGYAPGDSPALVHHAGDIVFAPTNTLTLEIGGTLRGTEYDALLATGSITLDGILQVVLIDGFIPQLGDQFDFLDGSNIQGDFQNYLLPTLPSLLVWDTSHLATFGTLSVSAVPEPASVAALAACTVLVLAAILRRRTKKPAFAATEAPGQPLTGRKFLFGRRVRGVG